MNHRQVIFTIGLIGVLLLVISKYGWAQVLMVEPAYLELELGKERPSGTFVVANISDDEVRCRAQAIHYRLSAEGQMEEIPPDGHSLASWIKFNPKEFTLAPKSSQNVRYSVIPNGRLEVGEYWGGIFFEPLVEKFNVLDTTNGVATKVKVVMSVLVPILGKYGDFEFSARLEMLEAKVTDKGISLRSVITNTSLGGLRLGGEYEIVDSSNQVAATGKFPAAFILPTGGMTISALVKQSLSQGTYTVRGRYFDRKTNQLFTSGETTFKVGPLEH